MKNEKQKNRILRNAFEAYSPLDFGEAIVLEREIKKVLWGSEVVK